MRKLFFILGWVLIFSLQSNEQSTLLVIDHTNLFNVHTGKVEANQTIIIGNGFIKSVGKSGKQSFPASATILDGRDKWVVPGLIDVHTHISGKYINPLKRTLANGVTSTLSIATSDSLLFLDEWSNHPDTASPHLNIVAGLFGEFPKNIDRNFKISPSNSVDDIKSSLINFQSKGINRVKIWQDDGELWFDSDKHFPHIPSEIIQTIIEETSKRVMQLYVHAWKLKYARPIMLSKNGMLIHPVIDSLVPTPLFSAMKKNNKLWVTTMAAMMNYGYPKEKANRILSDVRLKENLPLGKIAQLEKDRAADSLKYVKMMPTLFRDRDIDMKILRANTLQAKKSGVPIAVGSDDEMGVGTHLEMELLQETGLSPSEILIAATLNGAKFLGQGYKIGSVEAGKQADLLILTADPTKDIRNTRSIETIIKGGKMYNREELIKSIK